MGRLDQHADSTAFEFYIRDKLEDRFSAEPARSLTLFASTLFPQSVALRSAAPEPSRALKGRPKGGADKERLREMQRQAKQREDKRRKEEERLRREEEEDRVLQGKARLLDLDEQSRGMRQYQPHPCVAACVARWERAIKQVGWALCSRNSFILRTCFYYACTS